MYVQYSNGEYTKRPNFRSAIRPYVLFPQHNIIRQYSLFSTHATTSFVFQNNPLPSSSSSASSRSHRSNSTITGTILSLTSILASVWMPNAAVFLRILSVASSSNHPPATERPTFFVRFCQICIRDGVMLRDILLLLLFLLLCSHQYSFRHRFFFYKNRYNTI